MAEMKETIKRVSIDLFHKKGYFAASISDIARAAGIQKSSIYYHYSNKEDILFDIFKTTMTDLIAYLESQLRDEDSLEEKMRTSIRSHIIFHIDRQKEVIISDSELRGLTVGNYRRIIQMRNEYEKKFQALIRQGIEQGLFFETDYKVVSYALLTMCTAVAMWFKPQGRLSKEEVAQIYCDLVLNGLSARG